MAHLTPLHAAAAAAVASQAGVPRDGLKVDSTPRPELGDLAVGTFTFAKALGKSAPEAAADIAAAFVPNELLASATAAGAFVNFRANRPAVYRWLIGAALDRSLLPRTLGAGQTIVIDYSSPNVSKHLAYHHIRSTMLGHSLVQIFRALGYTVVGLNHLGDWGTTHGKLIAAWKKWGPTDPNAPVDISLLNDLYVRWAEAAKAAAVTKDTSLDDEGRAWFKKLEDGDPEVHALWARFKEISLAEYQDVYDLLGVKFDEVKGESEYLPDVPRVLAELADKGISSESEGALVVAFEGEKMPLMLKKRDDATLYATRDIPSAEYRWNTWHFARSLYVVDRGQSLHFKLLFKTLKAMGREWVTRCEHIPFGLVQIINKDGDIEKTGSRAGNSTSLKGVVAEADTRVRDLLAETNPDLSADSLARIAHDVGTGAVVFANLVSQRDKDVVFEWDRVIALSGDSGPYLQYSHARCASILRKAGAPLAPFAAIDLGKLTTDHEWAVARRLLDFPHAVVSTTPKCEPHIICHYLLDLAGEFSRWYSAGNADATLRVLVDDVPTRDARLALVAAVQAVLAEGLSLLGLAAPDQM
jgi:arginyl-tRNA synthetase